MTPLPHMIQETGLTKPRRLLQETSEAASPITRYIQETCVFNLRLVYITGDAACISAYPTCVHRRRGSFFGARSALIEDSSCEPAISYLLQETQIKSASPMNVSPLFVSYTVSLPSLGRQSRGPSGISSQACWHNYIHWVALNVPQCIPDFWSI